MSFPAKRLTLAPPTPPAPALSGVPDHLTARLRNLGARIRKRMSSAASLLPCQLSPRGHRGLRDEPRVLAQPIARKIAPHFPVRNGHAARCVFFTTADAYTFSESQEKKVPFRLRQQR
jgi:hypothetical protein